MPGELDSCQLEPATRQPETHNMSSQPAAAVPNSGRGSGSGSGSFQLASGTSPGSSTQICPQARVPPAPAACSLGTASRPCNCEVARGLADALGALNRTVVWSVKVEHFPGALSWAVCYVEVAQAAGAGGGTGRQVAAT